MKTNGKIRNPLVRAMARYYHEQFNKVNSVDCRSIDDICRQEKRLNHLVNSFNSLPEWLKNAVGNSRESQLY